MVTEYKKIVRTECYDWQKEDVNLSHLFSFLIGGIFFLWLKSILIDNSLYFLIYGVILAILMIISLIKKRVVTYVKVR